MYLTVDHMLTLVYLGTLLGHLCRTHPFGHLRLLKAGMVLLSCSHFAQ
jgi:hypothetical protein